MDPVLTPLIISAGVTATIEIGAASISVASILSSVIVAGTLTGASLALSESQKGKDKSKHSSEQFTVKESAGPRTRGYGTVKLGGRLGFIEGSVSLYTLIIHCEGPIDSFRQWWFNDTLGTPAAGSLGGVAGGGYSSFITVESHLGTDSQAASPILAAAFPGVWTSAHQLKGLAYTVMRCSLPPRPDKTIRNIYPNGAPQLRVEARLAKIYDPRDPAQDPNNSATWLWEDNAGLCILDFLTSPRGFGLPMSRMNLDSWSEFASMCSTLVPIDGGGTERRYRLGGIYSLNEEPRDVLRRMLATCDGEIIPFPDGTIGIRGGTWTEPTITITDSAILGYEYQNASEKMAAFNQLKITYTSPAHDYQITEADPYDDEENQALTGTVLTDDLSLPMVQSYFQARRLAKLAMAKGNPQHRFTNLTVNMSALDLLGERTVRLALADLGIDESFLITRFVPSDDLTTVTLDLISLGPDAYGEPEAGDPPAVPQDTTGADLTFANTDLTQAFWLKQNVTIGASIGGVGDLSAQEVIPNSSNTLHRVYQGATVTAGSRSVEAVCKEAGFGWIGLGFGGGATADGAFFNLETGAVGTAAAGTAAAIQSLGNGFYRCTVTRTVGTSITLQLEIHNADNQGATPLDATGSVFVGALRYF